MPATCTKIFTIQEETNRSNLWSSSQPPSYLKLKLSWQGGQEQNLKYLYFQWAAPGNSDIQIELRGEHLSNMSN